MLRKSSLFAALTVVLTTACTSNPTTNVAIEDAPAHLAEGACGHLEYCAGPFSVEFLPYPFPSCRLTFSETTQDQLLPLWKDAIANGTLVYDGHEMDACVAALWDPSRGCWPRFDVDICDRVLRGQVPPGGSCHIDAECEGARYCQTTACPGSCADRKPEHAACTDDSECVSGLYCDSHLNSCERPLEDGQRCGGGTLPECNPPTVCMYTDFAVGRPGTCRPIWEEHLVAVGRTCSPHAHPRCDLGASCALVAYDPATDTRSWSCEADSAADAPCKLAVPDACPIGQVCTADPINTGSVDGTCVAPPTAGQACLASGAVRCDFGLVCDGGECVSPGRLGDPCVAAAGCVSGHCSSSVCVAPTCS